MESTRVLEHSPALISVSRSPQISSLGKPGAWPVGVCASLGFPTHAPGRGLHSRYRYNGPAQCSVCRLSPEPVVFVTFVADPKPMFLMSHYLAEMVRMPELFGGFN